MHPRLVSCHQTVSRDLGHRRQCTIQHRPQRIPRRHLHTHRFLDQHHSKKLHVQCETRLSPDKSKLSTAATTASFCFVSTVLSDDGDLAHCRSSDCGGYVGPPTAFPVGHWCTVGVLAGTHRCATESRVTLWQKTNTFLWLLVFHAHVQLRILTF